ncbi:MAG: DUF4358 domain-containing protein [Eubacterium sp.]|jgi:hypothetical protein|nr:DUF4358 domain-containing protein [Eubacterium sp.]
MKSFKIILAIITALTLFGCRNEQFNIDPEDVTAKILSELDFPSPVEKTLSDIPDYYDIPTDDLESASFVICGSGAYPDEIAAFKFISDEKASGAAEALKKRLNDQIDLYEAYTPDEMYKLEGAEIIIDSNYAFLCATSDNETAKKIIDDFLNKK